MHFRYLDIDFEIDVTFIERSLSLSSLPFHQCDHQHWAFSLFCTTTQSTMKQQRALASKSANQLIENDSRWSGIKQPILTDQPEFLPPHTFYPADVNPPFQCNKVLRDACTARCIPCNFHSRKFSAPTLLRSLQTFYHKYVMSASHLSTPATKRHGKRKSLIIFCIRWSGPASDSKIANT